MEIEKDEKTGLFYQRNGDNCQLVPGQNEKLFCHSCRILFGSGEEREYLKDNPYHAVCLEKMKRHANSLKNRFWELDN